VYTLGINAAFHDSAACLVKDGVVLAAVEEERFTRIKHAKRPIPFSAYELPFHAIDYCLGHAGIRLVDVDHVAYGFDPFLSLGGRRNAMIGLPLEPSAEPPAEGWESPWEPLFLSYLVNAPRHLADGAPHHLRARFAGARADGPYKWHFVPHHLAHAASAFLPSPFPRAAVLTLDGRGEKATTSYWSGTGSRLAPLGTVEMPHSLGLVYEALTRHLGFLHSSDEYKVMALASYGKPVYLDEFQDMIRYEGDGRYRILQVDWTERFGPVRAPGASLEQRHYDLARSLQVVLEYTALQLVQWLHEQTQVPNLCLAGGVALNCVMNARLRDLGPFAEIWVQPAAGDAGTALGAAMWIDARLRTFPEIRPYVMEDVLLGPAYDDATIEAALRRWKLPYRRMEDVPEETAALLAEGQVVGWFQNRMEWGPRALGARSILASPLSPDMQDRMNDLKDREDFRPVAPVVPEERAADWFVKGSRSPFMLFVFDVLPGQAHRIPAARHVDGTARVQTVTRERHPRYYDLLRAFERRTGVPVLINTSFNTRSEPIVCTPRDAVEAFWTSPLDALVVGSFLLSKER
jgi:carbamoyltransferase